MWKDRAEDTKISLKVGSFAFDLATTQNTLAISWYTKLVSVLVL